MFFLLDQSVTSPAYLIILPFNITTFIFVDISFVAAVNFSESSMRLLWHRLRSPSPSLPCSALSVILTFGSSMFWLFAVSAVADDAERLTFPVICLVLRNSFVLFQLQMFIVTATVTSSYSRDILVRKRRRRTLKVFQDVL